MCKSGKFQYHWKKDYFAEFLPYLKKIYVKKCNTLIFWQKIQRSPFPNPLSNPKYECGCLYSTWPVPRYRRDVEFVWAEKRRRNFCIFCITFTVQATRVQQNMKSGIQTWNIFVKILKMVRIEHLLKIWLHKHVRFDLNNNVYKDDSNKQKSKLK